MPVIADEIYGTMTWKSHPFTPIAALTTTVERGKKASKEESYFFNFLRIDVVGCEHVVRMHVEPLRMLFYHGFAFGLTPLR